MSQVHGSSILNKENPNKAPDHLGSNVFTDLLSSTFYTVIGYVCLDVVFGISLHFIAQHNDPNSVAGLGLAFTTVNVLLIPMALGTNQSLNVHSPQALGAKKPKLAQSYFTLTIFIHLMYFIPFSIILILIKPLIAKTINEDDREATSDASQIYLCYLLPSTLFAILYECMKSFMIANKIFAVFMFIQLGTEIMFVQYVNCCHLIYTSWLKIIITKDYHQNLYVDLQFKYLMPQIFCINIKQYIVISNQRIYYQSNQIRVGLRQLILEAVVLKMKEFIVIYNLDITEPLKQYLAFLMKWVQICGVLDVLWLSYILVILFFLVRMNKNKLLILWKQRESLINLQLKYATRKKHFFTSNAPYQPLSYKNKKGKIRVPKSKDLQQILKCQDKLFIDFLDKCFNWDPQQRMKPIDALMHQWILEGLPKEIRTQHIKYLESEQKTQEVFFQNNEKIRHHHISEPEMEKKKSSSSYSQKKSKEKDITLNLYGNINNDTTPQNKRILSQSFHTSKNGSNQGSNQKYQHYFPGTTKNQPLKYKFY